jgi:hypothetical protein
MGDLSRPTGARSRAAGTLSGACARSKGLADSTLRV